MYLISHRGNLEGPNPSRENTKQYIEEATIQGFYVEIDVRGENGKLFLGHDSIQEEVDRKYLSNIQLWVHAKNMEAVELLKDWNRGLRRIHWFWHQTDDITMTSLGFIWTYPGKYLCKGAVAVLPENDENWNIENAGGICSDYISKFKL
jgi:hypothetical protein